MFLLPPSRDKHCLFGVVVVRGPGSDAEVALAVCASNSNSCSSNIIVRQHLQGLNYFKCQRFGACYVLEFAFLRGEG